MVLEISFHFIFLSRMMIFFITFLLISIKNKYFILFFSSHKIFLKKLKFEVKKNFGYKIESINSAL